MTQLLFVFLTPLRSRHLELEDQQSALELELRKYMEISGAYPGYIHLYVCVLAIMSYCRLDRAEVESWFMSSCPSFILHPPKAFRAASLGQRYRAISYQMPVTYFKLTHPFSFSYH